MRKISNTYLLKIMLTVVIFVGEISRNNTAIIGNKVTLKCPKTTLNNQPIVWWHKQDLIVIENNVRRELREYYSYESRTGDLTIYKTRVSDSGVYICGAKFDNEKHSIYLSAFTGNDFPFCWYCLVVNWRNMIIIIHCRHLFEKNKARRIHNMMCM